MIEARRLVKEYGYFRAVDKASFEVKRGEILGFLGPNGAGKSTTMKMLTGFLPPTSGQALIDGTDVHADPIRAKTKIGYLPERGPLYEEMTVNEFLGFIADIRGLNLTEREVGLRRVIRSCHLELVREQTIETLSKGFRQRVGMAQALLHDPDCLIMDEPTDGLDPNQKYEVRRMISEMGREKAIILSTHILEEVEAMCNRIIIIARGQIIVDETPDDLRKRHPMHNVVDLKVRERPLEDVKRDLEGMAQLDRIFPQEDGSLRVRPKEGQSILADLVARGSEKNWKLERIQLAPAPLEDVFRSLTTDEKPTSERAKA